MRFLIGIGAGVLYLALAGTGCKPQEDPAAQSQSNRAGGVAGVKGRIVTQNQLENLKVVLLNMDSPPTRVEDLKDHLKGDLAPFYDLFKNNKLVLGKNLKRDSRTVWVYEHEADGNGKRYVLKGDGSIHYLKEPEFQAALKGQ
jgi:hypothetical protein